MHYPCKRYKKITCQSKDHQTLKNMVNYAKTNKIKRPLMENLYAPWRSTYASDTGEGKKEKASESSCIFCNQLKQNEDEKNFILKRFDNTFVMLNKYPYNAGHLLVLPLKHFGTLNELSKVERTEIMEVINQSVDILSSTLKNDGLNVGLNLGKIAGAGIPSHLHFHVLPRWKGDTNFMPALAKTKVISFDIKKMYQALKKQFNKF